MAFYHTGSGRIPRATSVPLALLLIVVLGMATLVGVPRAGPAPAAKAAEEESTLLQLINGYRQQNGLSTLSVSTTLARAAQWMAQDMASNNYFSHSDSLGRDPFQRLVDFGYGYNTWRGENLVAGVLDPQQALDLWKASPPHNAVLLNPEYRVVGIGLAYSQTSTYCCYWAANFGGYDDATPLRLPPPTNLSAPPPAPLGGASTIPEPTRPSAQEPTPEPAPLEPVAAPTLAPTPTPSAPMPAEPTPGPSMPTPPPPPPSAPRPVLPTWQELAAGLNLVLARTTGVKLSDSLAATVSYLAQRYLAGRARGLYASPEGAPPGGPSRPGFRPAGPRVYGSAFRGLEAIGNLSSLGRVLLSERGIGVR